MRNYERKKTMMPVTSYRITIIIVIIIRWLRAPKRRVNNEPVNTANAGTAFINQL
jgi:hypothetical protein